MQSRYSHSQVFRPGSALSIYSDLDAVFLCFHWINPVPSEGEGTYLWGEVSVASGESVATTAKLKSRRSLWHYFTLILPSLSQNEWVSWRHGKGAARTERKWRLLFGISPLFYWITLVCYVKELFAAWWQIKEAQ